MSRFALNAALPPIKNVNGELREAFEEYLPGTGKWVETKASGDLIFVDGNAASASYLVISKDPLTAGTVSIVETNPTFNFKIPIEAIVGLHMSQRTLGQEFAVEFVDANTSVPTPIDLAISSITQTTTTLTIDTVTPHGLVPGKAIGVYGCSNPIANYPSLVVASVPSPTQITCTAGPGGTIASQTITNPAGAKGFIYYRTRVGLAANGVSQIFENGTATNSSLYVRSESGDSLMSGTVAGNHAVTVGTTASTQLVNTPYTYAFAPSTEFRYLLQTDRAQWMDIGIDSTSQANSRLVRTQVCPNPNAAYELRFRATNNKALTVPSAQIISATKTASTTATIVTSAPHGLVLGDPVVIYGIADQAATSFPNLTTATAVASVVDATTFTIVIGSSGTATSYGGYVAKVQGGNLMSSLGANAVVSQSVTLSTLADGTRQLVITGNASWSGLSIGDLVNLVGCRETVAGTSLALDGAWKVANVVTTALTLVLPYTGSMVLPADFGPTNAGGAIIKRTCLRISYIRTFGYDRLRIEAQTRPSGDSASAMPVVVQNTPSTTVSSGTITTVSTVTTVSAVTSANLAIPGTIADIASAAITTTTTTSAFTPTFGTAYEVNIPVTAVSGTTPTMDVVIQESDDSGTNWFDVYHFPRITATGIYRSPLLPLIGNRVRYVQTLTGTTPSFTRSLNRLQSSIGIDGTVRQLFDRAVSLTTLNATTSSLTIPNCSNVSLTINVGAITTTAPALQLEGSDDNGATWFALGSPLTAVASSTVKVTVNNVACQLLRARVSTAGVGVTAGYVLLRGF